MKPLFLIVLISCLVSLSFAQDDEAMIEELQKQRQEQQVQVEQIQESVEKIEKKPQELKEQVLSIDDLMSDKFIAMIEENLKNNPLREMDRDQIKQMLMGRVAGQPAEKLFKNLPVTLDITVDLMKDDKALLGLIQLAKKKKEMMNFTAIWLVLVISFWMIKKRIAPKTVSFRRRFVFKTALSLLGSVISFSLFYLMFSEEIGPFVSIVIKNLL